LHITLRPEIGEGRHEQYDRIVVLTEEVCRAGSGHFDLDGVTTIQVNRGPGEASISVFLTDDILIGSQIDVDLRSSLQRKARHQLRQAHQLGYKVGVLLDQIYADRVEHRSITCGHPETVKRTVEVVLSGDPDIIDRVWLRDHGESFHDLV